MSLLEICNEKFNEWIADVMEYPPHAWLDDPREPLFTFMWRNRRFGFYAMSFTYWAEILLVMLFEGLVAAIFSQIVLRFIISKRKTTGAYLLGYGIVIPFWLFFPWLVVDGLNVKNKIFRFCIAAVTPSLCVFRTTEAMHGFTPEHALQSTKAYTIYFSLPMVAKYDNYKKEYVKASSSYIRARFLEVIGSYAYTGSIYTLFLMYPDKFPQCGGEYELGYFNPRFLLSLRNLRDNASFLFLFESTLSTSGNGGNFVSTLLTGYEMEPFMNNPLFNSSTCSEFWNKNWNKLIQSLLSRGIYMPFRSILPTYFSLAATFLVSGLFHEWLMALVFAPLSEKLTENGVCQPPKCFEVTHGSAIVFFLWISVIITFEFLFLPKSFFRKPKIWYQVLCGSVAGLSGIFFLDPYVHTRFFNDGYVGYFMAQPLHQ